MYNKIENVLAELCNKGLSHRTQSIEMIFSFHLRGLTGLLGPRMELNPETFAIRQPARQASSPASNHPAGHQVS